MWKFLFVLTFQMVIRRADKEHPLLLFLHGAGERGSDLKRLAATGLPKHIEDGLDIPFVTVCPQCPENDWWDPIALKAVFENVVTTYNVDESRLYLSGLSMGGSGTWQLANILSRKACCNCACMSPIQLRESRQFQGFTGMVFSRRHGFGDTRVRLCENGSTASFGWL